MVRGRRGVVAVLFRLLALCVFGFVRSSLLWYDTRSKSLLAFNILRCFSRAFAVCYGPVPSLGCGPVCVVLCSLSFTLLSLEMEFVRVLALLLVLHLPLHWLGLTTRRNLCAG